MLVSPRNYRIIIICCVKEQNKLFCIIICYCEIKLKWPNIVFVLKENKSPILKVEEKLSGGIIILCYINKNILISHPPSLVVCQDKYEN